MNASRDNSGHKAFGNAATASEQRREPRRAARGSVEVKWSDPVPAVINGSLVDVSPSGFRMSHTCVALEAGLIVEFAYDEASGKARVVWTRVLTQESHAALRVESGFVILS